MRLSAMLMIMHAGLLATPLRASDQINLIENGEAHCNIVVPGDAPEVTKFAVAALATHMKEMTGVDVPIVSVREPGTLAIELQPRPWRDEAFDITKDNGGITIKAGERAILPAVYRLLEEMGCRFLAPKFDFYEGHADHVPRATALAFSPHEPITTKPQFPFRKLYVEEGLSHTRENLLQLIEWMPKAGFNTLVIPSDYQNMGRVKWDHWRDALTPELRRRHIIIEVGGHGYQNFINAKMTDGGKPLFEAHPEWFALDDKGQRREAEKYVFCTSDEPAFAYFQKNVEDYVKQRPEIEIFDLWPPDGAVWCACDNCKAIGEPQDRQAVLMNRMHDAFRAFGGPRLEMIAYSKALLPPKRQKIDPSIMVDFCPINQQFEYQIDDPASQRNNDYAAALVDWRKQFTGDISLYSYYRKYAWRSLPAVIPHYIQKDLQWYATLPLQGISVYSEPADWGTYELNHYVLGKLAWDVDADVDALVKDFCAGRYPRHAELAAKTLVELGDIVRKTGTIRFTELKSPEQIATAKQRIDTLATEVKKSNADADAPEHKALVRLELMLGYASCDLAVRHSKASKESPEQLLQKVENVAEYFGRNADCGVFETGDKEQLPRFQRLHGLPTQTEPE